MSCESGSVSSLQTPTWSKQREEQPGQQPVSTVQTPQLQSPQLRPGATGEKSASCHMVPQPIPLFNSSSPAIYLSLSRSLFSLRLQITGRRDRIPRPTCCSSTKRSSTGCSGRRRSWSEALLLCSPVTRTHTTHQSNYYILFYVYNCIKIMINRIE